MGTYKAKHERMADGAQRVTMQFKQDEHGVNWHVQHELSVQRWSSLALSHPHDCRLNVYAPSGKRARVGFF